MTSGSLHKLRLHFLAFDHVRTPHNLHFLCSKFSVFLTTYPPLNANVTCEGSQTEPLVKNLSLCLAISDLTHNYIIHIHSLFRDPMHSYSLVLSLRNHSSITSAKRWVDRVGKWQLLLIYSTIYADVGGITDRNFVVEFDT